MFHNAIESIESALPRAHSPPRNRTPHLLPAPDRALLLTPSLPIALCVKEHTDIPHKSFLVTKLATSLQLWFATQELSMIVTFIWMFIYHCLFTLVLKSPIYEYIFLHGESCFDFCSSSLVTKSCISLTVTFLSLWLPVVPECRRHDFPQYSVKLLSLKYSNLMKLPNCQVESSHFYL